MLLLFQQYFTITGNNIETNDLDLMSFFEVLPIDIDIKDTKNEVSNMNHLTNFTNSTIEKHKVISILDQNLIVRSFIGDRLNYISQNAMSAIKNNPDCGKSN